MTFTPTRSRVHETPAPAPHVAARAADAVKVYGKGEAEVRALVTGFYTSMQGGRGELHMNLDGRGAAERTGQFAVRKFRVLGDPVIYEVLQGVDEGRPAIATATPRRTRRTATVREEIKFDDLKASFSTGNGQLVLEGLGATGPLVGVSLRGKADFRSRRLSLGGTYVPLSGLNRALSGIPLLRELFTGPQGRRHLRHYLRRHRPDGRPPGHRQSVLHRGAGRAAGNLPDGARQSPRHAERARPPGRAWQRCPRALEPGGGDRGLPGHGTDCRSAGSSTAGRRKRSAPTAAVDNAVDGKARLPR